MKGSNCLTFRVVNEYDHCSVNSNRKTRFNQLDFRCQNLFDQWSATLCLLRKEIRLRAKLKLDSNSLLISFPLSLSLAPFLVVIVKMAPIERD